MWQVGLQELLMHLPHFQPCNLNNIRRKKPNKQTKSAATFWTVYKLFKDSRGTFASLSLYPQRYKHAKEEFLESALQIYHVETYRTL